VAIHDEALLAKLVQLNGERKTKNGALRFVGQIYYQMPRFAKQADMYTV
jgi:hypothetical protein